MPIQYNVSTLLTESVGSTREYDIDDRVRIDDAGASHARVSGHATLLRTKGGVLVQARMQGVQREGCSRCLAEVETPLRLDIEEEFFATADAASGSKLPAPGDPDALFIDARHTLDLGEAVRQYWAGALSMQPLCRPDCRGLCPRCGRDLNQSACSCPVEQDERWGALRQLVNEREGS